jgi:uncharacterized protein
MPTLGMLRIPDARIMWSRALIIATIGTLLYLLNSLTFVLLDKWMLESLGLEEVFWTNFRAGSLLFLWGFAGTAVSIGLPAFLSPLNDVWRRIVVTIALLGGLVGGYLLSQQYLTMLALAGAATVGEIDPVFGNDIGFYMFTLPGLWVIWWALTIPLTLGLISGITCIRLAARSGRRPDAPREDVTDFLSSISTPFTLTTFAILGVLSAAGVWLARYGLLLKDNYNSAVYAGAEYIDVVGLFSTLNYYNLTTAIVLLDDLLIVAALFLLVKFGRRIRTSAGTTLSPMRMLVYGLVILIAVDFGFAGAVALRDVTRVSPNEPVIQLPYIQRHIEGTLRGYDLHNVETVNFVPYGANDPIPDADTLLQTATLRNAPLWPGWVSYLERLVDPQHAARVLQTEGDSMVYGPTLDILRAQQKLRTYYNFLDVDTVRYTIDGEKQMLVSAVREVPLADPQPWVTWWGQRMLLFTHGHGLVMLPTGEVRGEGEPVYVAGDIPMRADAPELLPANPSVYYGEGGGTEDYDVMGFSNAEGIREFSYPSDEDRVEVVYPPDVHAGVQLDSFLKRLVVGWRSGVAFDIWFSGMLTSDTRAHYYRRPLTRLDRIAPFLFFDANTYAVVADDRIKWIVNGITTSDRYPYSRHWDLGDKSADHSPDYRPDRRVNYVRDSVKIVVDAYTGAVNLYQISDEPVAATWANVYPSLFTPGTEMPDQIRSHLTFPSQMFHLQFDNIYYKYHMTDPMTFYNMEDMWDDGDEVKGPILDDGKAITFSIEPRNWIGVTGDVLPASSEATQFISSMVFTNEQAPNLRAVPLVYQDGDDYGRQIVLQVPKGHFYPGPEQADAMIDQDPDASEQIGWWNRQGSEVIRGHTSTLIIGREVIYVEPLFIRSRQSPTTQLKRVSVVFRGHVFQAETLPEALAGAIERARRAAATGQVALEPRGETETR